MNRFAPVLRRCSSRLISNGGPLYKLYTLFAVVVGFAFTPKAYAENLLHVVSIYESQSGVTLAHTRGDVTVNVDTAGNNVLVLASYEPVRWIVNSAEGTNVSKIILIGYNRQSVVQRPFSGVQAIVSNFLFDTGAAEVNAPVILKDVVAYADCFGGEYQPNDPDDRWAQGLVRASERWTARRVTSFSTAYRGNVFNLSYAPTYLTPQGTFRLLERVRFGFNTGDGFLLSWNFPLIPPGQEFQNFQIELHDTTTGTTQYGFAPSNTGKAIFLDPGDRGHLLQFRVRVQYSERDSSGNVRSGPWSARSNLQIPANLVFP